MKYSSKDLKVVTIVGARPQFIKAAVVSQAILKHDGIKEVLVHTGQHYDDNMSDVFFAELGIPAPCYNLGVGSGLHGAQTGKMLKLIEEVLLKELPDWLMVYGDTNSTLAGALAASKLHIPIAHVEAGLRSYNRKMPEEINRVLTDHMSALLLAPSNASVSNLTNEGIGPDMICQAGDVMYDASLYYGEKAKNNSTILRSLAFAPSSYILMTLHRAENTDSPERMRAVLEGVCEVSNSVPVVWPVHPRTRHILNEMDFSLNTFPNFKLIDPVGYLDMVQLVQNAKLIVSDSGGVQKEAFFHQVPCVTLRDETEWVELVDLGWNRLVPPISSKSVYEGILQEFNICNRTVKPYGNGCAAEKIIEKICSFQ